MKIEWKAFKQCISLKNMITIPESENYLYSVIFDDKFQWENHPQLTTVYYTMQETVEGVVISFFKAK